MVSILASIEFLRQRQQQVELASYDERLIAGARALHISAKLGIRIERVMTDNGSCYRSKTFRAACKRLGLRQIFTKPYTPQTNGKAERFIQTALREWAYAPAYQNSRQRSAELLIGCIVTIGIARMLV
jgi:transposase InsO family protein